MWLFTPIFYLFGVFSAIPILSLLWVKILAEAVLIACPGFAIKFFTVAIVISYLICNILVTVAAVKEAFEADSLIESSLLLNLAFLLSIVIHQFLRKMNIGRSAETHPLLETKSAE